MSRQLGWLDTDIFLHSLYRDDPERDRAREILADLEDGNAEAWIDPLVVHELLHALGRHPAFRKREDVYAYLRAIVQTDAIHADDKSLVIEALARWNATQIGFVDAWLRVLAEQRELPVCSANRDGFVGIENTF